MSLSKIKIQKVAQNLIGHFDPKAEVKADFADEVWRIDISTEDSPILIGRHGQTLQALEHLLRLMVAQEADEYLAINLDISGYKAAREAEIIQMAKDAAAEAIATSKEQSLPPMNSYERRLAHMALAEITEVETSSVGEEPYRKIVVKVKSS